jgi:hypothetical protein
MKNVSLVPWGWIVITAIVIFQISIAASFRFSSLECRKIIKVGKGEHHLWKKKDSAGSGQKALSLVRTVC